MGLFSNKTSTPEPFPLQSSVMYRCPQTKVSIRGTVTGIPSSSPGDKTYIITLVDDRVLPITTEVMTSYCTKQESTSHSSTVNLPVWLRPDAKASMDINGQYTKGYIRFPTNNHWSFEHTTKHGHVISTVPIPNFINNFQSLINENLLLPGWGVHTFASASLVSATQLKNPCPQASLWRWTLQISTATFGSTPTKKNTTAFATATCIQSFLNENIRN